MITWSNPAYLSSGPKNPPALLSPRMPVRGERALTFTRHAPENAVPTRGPVANMSRFSGEKGSTSGGTSS